MAQGARRYCPCLRLLHMGNPVTHVGGKTREPYRPHQHHPSSVGEIQATLYLRNRPDHNKQRPRIMATGTRQTNIAPSPGTSSSGLPPRRHQLPPADVLRSSTSEGGTHEARWRHVAVNNVNLWQSEPSLCVGPEDPKKRRQNDSILAAYTSRTQLDPDAPTSRCDVWWVVQDPNGVRKFSCRDSGPREILGRLTKRHEGMKYFGMGCVSTLHPMIEG